MDLELPVIRDCSNCGVCCTMEADPPYTEAEFQQLPLRLKLRIEAFRDGPLHGKPCLFLDRASGRCMEYELRPQACRDFELGGYRCVSERYRAGVGT